MVMVLYRSAYHWLKQSHDNASSSWWEMDVYKEHVSLFSSSTSSRTDSNGSAFATCHHLYQTLWFTLILWHVMVWISASHTKPSSYCYIQSRFELNIHICWTVHLTLLQQKSLCVIWGFGEYWPLMLGAHWRIQINARPTDHFKPQHLEPREKTSHHNVAITANSQRTQCRRQMFCSLQILAQLSAFICINAHAWDYAKICLHDLSLCLRTILFVLILLIKTILIIIPSKLNL